MSILNSTKPKLACLTLVLALAWTGTAAVAACSSNEGTYRLVEDPSLALRLLPPPPESAVEFASVKIEKDGTTILEGTLTSSQGYPTVYFLAKHPKLSEADISVDFFDSNLKVASQNAEYLVSPSLPSALYYRARELWSRINLQGKVWRRETATWPWRVG